ncbi:DNA helicase [Klebsiella sp. RIT-PI-d]|uniref:RecQ family ATP-dependent DNA helicase n=1 Tax=Klebsiella sp. RIT-PI-d TaxID=1681196 RepID=UPI000676AE45|nr:RecQ family ATP-dependent DNA helicase [Klebsiella sp. RIT-PI-d]KNC06430.1 DNA helicase [Klebsiella sp. RIT-PI-d]
MEQTTSVLDLKRVLSFDIELSRDNTFRQLGAVLADEILNIKGHQDDAIARLDHLAKDADVILGHNILDFDLPWLSAQPVRPHILLDKPIIDTLYLSPLAFPANPYHRLIKDYKLVRDTINDPVNDSRLALQIFAEQLTALRSKPLEQLQLYQYLFEHGISAHFTTRGLAQVFAALTGKKSIQAAALPTLVKAIAQHKVCPNQLSRVIGDALREPQKLLPLAFACAWLPVSGGNSVLPPWVWRKFPATADIIRELREEKCQEATCGYCLQNHDARRHLQHIFELPDFRNLPDGTPLQRDIVECGLASRPLLGILPTSGGKSLCYQLPAIVRNQRNGSLTLVISPLQALMKDQVDNLRQKAGIEGVAAISGMLTLPERGAILEQVRQGDIAILYLSPEQLRNRAVKNAIRQRQIGGWVFDEAHCLSKWGHDFRPDYLYCATVIDALAKEQQVPVPPVFCYTATAKLDVINDICSHFQNKIPQPLARFEGGVERVNLHYDILESRGLSKLSQILSLLEQFFGDGQPGSCVIYCATRKSVDEISDALMQQQSLPVAKFYARLESAQKKEILEGFIAGQYRIVCATNAFGMGIDKDDVRLVVHAEIPGSLENYLQEAGRAGRDTLDAHCVLLFDEQDIEKQFRLQAISEVSFKDIRQIFSGIKRKVNDKNEVVATSAELINQPMVETSFTADDSGADTKVKTGIAWLERVGYVERSDNITQVFQGKVAFASLEEAQEKIRALNLNPPAAQLWNAILQALINADDDDGLSADTIADDAAKYLSHGSSMTEAKDVMRVLTQMADLGLITKGLLLTAHIRPKGKDNARVTASQIQEIEKAMLSLLREQFPDPELGVFYSLHLRKFNQLIIDLGHERSHPSLLRNLLYSWSQDGRQSGQKGSIEFRYDSRDSYQMAINRQWSTIEKIIQQRHRLTNAVLGFLYHQAAASDENSVRRIMLSFALEQVLDYLRQDVDIIPLLQERDPGNEQEWLIKGAERALLYLHEQHAITLQNGLAVFRAAMSLRLNVEKAHRYVKADYQPLEQHYQQKILQIHVMNEYAKLGLDKPKAAQKLVKDYFALDAESFLPLYFKGRRKVLDLATSESSWKRIVDDLHNQSQEQIVQAGLDQNMLVLAGPGSGKSKVIVHRCAYLMRVKQVDPRKILLLCYNHNAAQSLRRRLKALLGRDGSRVTVQTFHGLALSLTGHAVGSQDNEEINFTSLLQDAIALLKGEETQLGLEMEGQREHLLGGLEYLLVDEYQDIDEQQYQLIAALAGMSAGEDDVKLSLMAVGDDDQSIYGFRDASVTFIQRFAADYEAQTHYLTWNYRSTANIIAASNQLIEHNHNRMKNAHPITIDENRRLEPRGGKWQATEPCRGTIEIVRCQDSAQQAAEVVQQVQRIREIDPTCPHEQIAVLARNGIDKNELVRVRSALADADIACRFTLDKDAGFPVRACREIVDYQQWLREQRLTPLTPQELREALPALALANRWHILLHDLIDQWEGAQGDEALPAEYFDLFLQEYLNAQRRQVRFGSGVLLSTVHGVKGEEFEHVIILDGGWASAFGDDVQNQQEERRLFYVGMTRAISRLVLMQVDNQQNPHIPLLEGGPLSYQRSQAIRPEKLRRFLITGLAQLNIGFAGAYQDSHEIHSLLTSLKPGEQVELVAEKQSITVMLGEKTLAQFSRNGRQRWEEIVPAIRHAEVLAVLQRNKHQEGEKFQSKCKVDSWYIPILMVETEDAQ